MDDGYATTSSLKKIQSKNIYVLLEGRESDHTNNDLNYTKKKKASYIEKSKPKVEIAKVGDKSKKKKLTCIYCSKFNYNEDNCFILHPYKQ